MFCRCVYWLYLNLSFLFFFKQKTAYEMRISDWSSDVCSSDLLKPGCAPLRATDPNFYACYQPVGDFPDVALSPKLIITRLITAFGVCAKGDRKSTRLNSSH